MSKYGKPAHNKGRYKWHDRGRIPKTPKLGPQVKEGLEGVDENSPTIQIFKNYAKELDAKHDRYERIVKISRDVTVESKRIIFALHSIESGGRKKEEILKEVEDRLQALVSQHYMLIAMELDGQDFHLYHRAFSSGLQEFIEAYTFFDYIRKGEFDHWDSYQNKLTYEIKPRKSVAEELNAANSKSPPEPPRKCMAYIPPTDFILGLADLSGELMRKCLNNLGFGDIETCHNTRNLVSTLNKGFLLIGSNRNKEMYHKTYTLQQSLIKMENVCYIIHRRGSEITKHMLADAIAQEEYPDKDEDEGFCN